MRHWRRVVGIILMGATMAAGCSSGGDPATDWNKSRTKFDDKANERALAVLARVRAAGIDCTKEQTEVFGVLFETYRRQKLPLPFGSASCVGPGGENLLVELFPKGRYPSGADFIQRKREIVCQKALNAGYRPNGANDFPGVPYLLSKDETWVLEPDSFGVNKELAKALGLRSRNACAGMKGKATK